MKIILRKINKHNIKSSFFLLILFSCLIFTSISNQNIIFNDNNYTKSKVNGNFIERPKLATIDLILNLTNKEINNTRHYHNTQIQIIGKVVNGSSVGQSEYIIGIIINSESYSYFNDTSDSNGEFNITLIIPMKLNIYSSHKLMVDVLNPGGKDVKNDLNHYIIYANASSFFNLDSYNQNKPYLIGSDYDIPGYLSYDNSSGIGGQTINYMWYNQSMDKISSGSFNTFANGSFPAITFPSDNSSSFFFLNLSYSGTPTLINGSQKIITINAYRNVTCQWSADSSAEEGDQIIIQGRLFARSNPQLYINFTTIRLRFNAESIGTDETKADGRFQLTYQIPSGSAGSNQINLEILGFSTVFSNQSHVVSVSSAAPAPVEDVGGDDDETPPPFFNFFMVLIPIIIGIAAAFLVYAYFYLKRQDKKSKIVNVPLAGKIRNLKVLKDSGRIEEAVSYLFQAIYMELVDGKFGRRIKPNETIRDFAIVSVKDFKLNPASIYPFITKLEEIIYSKPFEVTEKDFYFMIELFSPIYYSLTNYNFVLNF